MIAHCTILPMRLREQRNILSDGAEKAALPTVRRVWTD
jgi:hypothetical protein